MQTVTRRRLDRDAVVLEAAKLCDESGFEKLSIAALADRLGVRPPSLYNHVKSLDDVYQQMALMGLRLWTARLRDVLDAAPAQKVRAVAHATRDFARAQPTLFQCATRNFSGQDEEYLAASAPLVAIIGEVFPGSTSGEERGALNEYLMRCLIFGFISLEANNGLAPARDLDALYDDLIDLAGQIVAR